MDIQTAMTNLTAAFGAEHQAVQDLFGAFDGLKVEIVALQAQIAQGQAVTPEQLQALADSATADQAAIAAKLAEPTP